MQKPLQKVHTLCSIDRKTAATKVFAIVRGDSDKKNPILPVDKQPARWGNFDRLSTFPTLVFLHGVQIDIDSERISAITNSISFLLRRFP